MVLTVEGIVPLQPGDPQGRRRLELAMVSREIKPDVARGGERARPYPWTIKRWDESGGVFVAMPGGGSSDRSCLVAELRHRCLARASN